MLARHVREIVGIDFFYSEIIFSISLMKDSANGILGSTSSSEATNIML